MNIRNRVAFAAATLGAFLSLSAVSAKAITLDADFVSYNNSTALGESITFNYNGSSKSGYAGMIYFQLYSSTNGGVSYTNLYASQNTYCVDLNTDISPGQNFLVQLSTSNVNLHNGGEIAYLYDKYQLGTHGSGNVITTATQAAALQLAMWKLVYDNTTSMTSGIIQKNSSTDPTVLTDTQTYLSDAAAHPYTDEANWLDATFGGTESPTGQGQMGPSQVPEGGFFGLLGSLTTAGAAFRYRRKRAKG